MDFSEIEKLHIMDIQVWRSRMGKVLTFPKLLNNKSREELILEYLPKVRIMAKKIRRRATGNFDLDDLIHWGVLGLIDAIDKFDREQNVQFNTYAEYRIRGQMLDALRNEDWAPRSTRDQIKNYQKLELELEGKFGREVTHKEMRKEMGLDVKAFYHLLQRIFPITIISLYNARAGGIRPNLKLVTTSDEGPCSNSIKHDVEEKVQLLLNTLSEREGTILKLYYFENLTMKEISQSIKCTESRVSQIHRETLKKLKYKEGELKYLVA